MYIYSPHRVLFVGWKRINPLQGNLLADDGVRQAWRGQGYEDDHLIVQIWSILRSQ